MNRFVYKLSDNIVGRSRMFGIKASSLAKLQSEGFNVPRAFVVSVEVFDRIVGMVLRDTPVAKDLTAAQRADILDRIVQSDLPDDIADEIIEAYCTLGAPVAVRSSMVVEDGAESSFAGQLETFLDITTEESLLIAVKRCIASAFSDRVCSYAKKLSDLSSTMTAYDFRTAVLVQVMVPATYAGVAFSADPHSGRRCVIIEGTPGAGAAVARGTVDPDRYVITAQGKLLVEHSITSANNKPDADNILELAKIVRRISSEAGTAQDVEWAWDGTTFHILQARPITSLAGKEIFSNKLVSNMTPGLIKPLLWSTNIIDMTVNVFGRIFKALFGTRQIDYRRIVKLIHSRVFVNVTFVSDLMTQLGLPANFFEMVVLDELAEKPRLRFSPRLVRSILRMTAFILRYGFYADAITSFLSLHEKRLKSFRSKKLSQCDAAVLLDAVRKLRQAHGETQWYMWISAMNTTIRNKLLKRYITDRVSHVDPYNLLAGRRGLKSLEPNVAIRNISSQVKKLDQSLPDLLIKGDDESIRARLLENTQGREIVDAFDRFMNRYGFLSTHGTDFSVPPWKETPHIIWNGIGRLATLSQNEDVDNSRAIRENTEALIASRLNIFQRFTFRRLLTSTLRYLDYRERMSFYMSEDVYQMRRIYSTIGKRLVNLGALQVWDEIFFCDFEEIAGMVNGTLAPSMIQATIQERKNEFIENEKLELDDIICDESVAGVPKSHEPTSCLSGIVGSAGIAHGYAVVVENPAEVSQPLSKRDILVVPFTDVGWTPLFPSIGGLIAETGGQLSHSAIIAREYGIPAVVSVKDATRLLRNGQPVTVDGNTGRVYSELSLEREGDL
jgi:phosphohistidine swiveling domain-containing protein